GAAERIADLGPPALLVEMEQDARPDERVVVAPLDRELPAAGVRVPGADAADERLGLAARGHRGKAEIARDLLVGIDGEHRVDVGFLEAAQAHAREIDRQLRERERHGLAPDDGDLAAALLELERHALDRDACAPAHQAISAT